MRLVRRIRDFVRARKALRDFRRSIAGRPSPWLVVDLDNTLIDTGGLMAKGDSLHRAAENALPIDSMLTFVEELRTSRLFGSTVFLSARPHVLERVTHRWLAKHRVIRAEDVVVLTPRVTDKVAFWQLLRGLGSLAIIDDLAYGHHEDTPTIYRRLAARARSLSDIYVGYDEIEEIQRDPAAKARMLLAVREAISRSSLP